MNENVLGKKSRLELGFLTITDVASTLDIPLSVVQYAIELGYIEPKHGLSCETKDGKLLTFPSKRKYFKEEEIPDILEKIIKSREPANVKKFDHNGLPPKSYVKKHKIPTIHYDVDGNKLYDIKESSKLLNMSMNTFRIYHDNGRLPIKPAYREEKMLWTYDGLNKIRDWLLEIGYYIRMKKTIPDVIKPEKIKDNA